MADAARQRGNELSETTATVAREVAERRTELGLTRRELAERLTVAGRRFTADAVQKLEATERRIDVDDLSALAGVLETTPARLLGGGGAGRIKVRDYHAMLQRNPLMRSAISAAVIRNGESRADLIDFVDHAARSVRAWHEWHEFENAIQAASDDEAATMIIENKIAHEVTDIDVLGALVGGGLDRAKRIAAKLAESDQHGEG